MNLLGQIVWQALRQARWLPSTEPFSRGSPFAEVAPGDDILPALALAWSRAEVAPEERRRGDRLQTWARDRIAGGARLTIGPDPARDDGFRRWNGARLIWWPRGIPAGARVGVVSSHLGRHKHRSRDWFRVFRAACANVDRRREVMVTAATTTTDVFARRAAELFDLRVLWLSSPARRQTLRGWLDAVARRERPDTGCYEAHVSPALDNNLAGAAAEFVPSPLADRMTIAMSDRLLLFHVRPRGKLLPLIRRRLADPAWQPQTVQVALGPELVPRAIADELLAAGAVGWVVLGGSTAGRARDAAAGAASPLSAGAASPLSAPAAPVAGTSRIMSAPPEGEWTYLTHCTRAARGAWPDQSANDFLDDLIFSSEFADHSALAALRRILVQQRILATSSAIRGGMSLVSFTAVPLLDVPRLRTFRVHRGRWDFEPYGICIRRDHLRQAGARPVIYGEPADWDRLPAADRPFFQRRFSENVKTGARIDWSREREWRLPGNVDLGLVDDTSALVFVPTVAEARQLLPACRWPIIVMDAA